MIEDRTVVSSIGVSVLDELHLDSKYLELFSSGTDSTEESSDV
jgi:hypothetical protein